MSYSKQPITHLFEGEQMTTAQIRARVPCLGLGTIRAYLAEGRNTVQAMLTRPRTKKKLPAVRKRMV